MLTKSDFQKAIQDSITSYPALGALYQAGDPRMLQHLDAMATMLSMLSAQVETAMSEPFEKSRDATVLADASMRGIIMKGSPARVRVRARNKGRQSYTLESGRTIVDSSGASYRVETSASVPAESEATVEATQVRSVKISHTVTASEPFYSIEIPPSEDGDYLAAVSVYDDQGRYEFRDRYVNVLAGDRVFHIESDDRQRVYVRFGLDGVVGTQPRDGTKFELVVLYTAGNITPQAGSPFAFDYLNSSSPAEPMIELSMDALIAAGRNPISISTLADLARYPSVYDNNAVFLGEFDFLVRRNFPDLQFLSVWNESAEEEIRGASLENINTLFVACVSASGGEQILDEESPSSPVAPVLIADDKLTGTQKQIKASILAADDSYRVRFYTPVRSKISMRLTARVSSSYVASDVRQKISEVILSEFGQTSAVSRRGRNRPLYQRIYALLKSKVPALSDGNSDLIVHIDEPENMLRRCEMWRFATEDSISVSVVISNILTPSWGG